MDSEFAVSAEAAVRFAPWRRSDGDVDDRIRLDLMAQCKLPHRRQTPADVVDTFALGYRKIILNLPPDDDDMCDPKPNRRRPVK